MLSLLQFHQHRRQPVLCKEIIAIRVGICPTNCFLRILKSFPSVVQRMGVFQTNFWMNTWTEEAMEMYGQGMQWPGISTCCWAQTSTKTHQGCGAKATLPTSHSWEMINHAIAHPKHVPSTVFQDKDQMFKTPSILCLRSSEIFFPVPLTQVWRKTLEAEIPFCPPNVQLLQARNYCPIQL